MANFYLTIDDAPTKDTGEKLDFLLKNNIPAIWFCVGKSILDHSDAALKCIKSGHIIANHSYDHPHFSQIDLAAAKEQILETEKVIADLYKSANRPRPAKLFRFPYGDQGDLKNGIPSHKSSLLEHKSQIREFLIKNGFNPGPSSDIQYPGDYYSNQPQDPFWGWSYDIREWNINRGAGKKIGLQEVKDNLNEYLNTYNRHKDQIFIIHDHEETTLEFPALISQIIDHGASFILPRF